MRERIVRDSDEVCYQPKIHIERIRCLFRISQETKTPMTVLVDYSIGMFIEAYEKKKREKEALQDELNWSLENRIDEQEEPDDDEEDLDVYLDRYQNDQYGEDY